MLIRSNLCTISGVNAQVRTEALFLPLAVPQKSVLSIVLNEPTERIGEGRGRWLLINRMTE